MDEMYAQYGIAGLMIAAMLYGIRWSGIRLIGSEGIVPLGIAALENNSKAIERIAEVIDRNNIASAGHIESCVLSHEKVTRLHEAAIAALDEIEVECKVRGIDVSAPCNRIRATLG